MADFPVSTLLNLLEPELFFRSPSSARSWALDMVSSGFETESLFDIVALGDDEWEGLQQKLQLALTNVGLGDEDRINKCCLQLLDRELQNQPALDWMAQFDPIASRLLNAEGWRRSVGVLIHEIGDFMNLIDDGFEVAPPNYDPPCCETFIREAWRSFFANGELPMGLH
jgi:hypothetical protein